VKARTERVAVLLPDSRVEDWGKQCCVEERAEERNASKQERRRGEGEWIDTFVGSKR